jgi:hypothetical protein
LKRAGLMPEWFAKARTAPTRRTNRIRTRVNLWK